MYIIYIDVLTYYHIHKNISLSNNVQMDWFKLDSLNMLNWIFNQLTYSLMAICLKKKLLCTVTNICSVFGQTNPVFLLVKLRLNNVLFVNVLQTMHMILMLMHQSYGLTNETSTGKPAWLSQTMGMGWCQKNFTKCSGQI